MSYDVYIVTPGCSTCGKTEDESHTGWNPTWNLSPMFPMALAGKPFSDEPDQESPYGLRLLSGKLLSETVAALDLALYRMKIDPERYQALDAPNGWGVYADAISVFEGLRKLAADVNPALKQTWLVRN